MSVQGIWRAVRDECGPTTAQEQERLFRERGVVRMETLEWKRESEALMSLWDRLDAEGRERAAAYVPPLDRLRDGLRSWRASRAFSRSCMPIVGDKVGLDELVRRPNPYWVYPLKGLDALFGRDFAGRARLSRVLGRYEFTPTPLGTTSFGAEVLFPFIEHAPLGDRGFVIGPVSPTNKALIFDSAEAYGNVVDVGNQMVFGDTNGGKSAYLKICAIRGIKIGRQVLYIDSKPVETVDEAGNKVMLGEATALARAVGGTTIRFTEGGTTRINPCDRRIVARSGSGESANSSIEQDALIHALIVTALGGPLDARGKFAVSRAHNAAVKWAEDEAIGRDPELKDVIRFLQEPKEEDARLARVDREELAKWGETAALTLLRFTEDDLKGMADGQTNMEWDEDAPLIHVDISALRSEGVQLSIAMALVAAYMRNSWIKPDGIIRYIIVDEGWHIISQESIALLFQRLWKFWRSLGIVGITAMHRPSDLPAHGSIGSQSRALLNETGVNVSFVVAGKKSREEVVELFGFSEQSGKRLAKLPRGTCLMKFGQHPELEVPIPRTRFEIAVTDTDQAFVGRSKSVAA